MKRVVCSLWGLIALLMMVSQAGATPSGIISGFKWEDLNGDGTHQSGEPGLEGWTITLKSDLCYPAGACSGGMVDLSTLTNSFGYFSFSGLTSGLFLVEEMLQPGWKQTSLPASYAICLYTGADICGSSAPPSFYEANFLNQRVPEPGTFSLLGLAFAGLAAARRRKR